MYRHASAPSLNLYGKIRAAALERNSRSSIRLSESELNPEEFTDRVTGEVARAGQPEGYPKRTKIPHEKISWANPFASYTAEVQTYTAKEVQRAKEADREEGPFQTRPSAHPEQFDQFGKPRNPFGRTGLQGRGGLYKWGVNAAADPIVTRWVKSGAEERKLEVILISRMHGQKSTWGCPGGMLQGDESSSVDYKEAALQNAKKAFNAKLSGVDLKSAKPSSIVYKGYVDDARNTDNAWMETTVCHLHFTAMVDLKQTGDQQLVSPRSSSGSAKPSRKDAAQLFEVRWVAVSKDGKFELPHDKTLYPPHAEWIQYVAKKLLNDGSFQYLMHEAVPELLVRPRVAQTLSKVRGSLQRTPKEPKLTKEDGGGWTLETSPGSSPVKQMLSPLEVVNTPPGLRTSLGIPFEARYFAFVYPASKEDRDRDKEYLERAEEQRTGISSLYYVGGFVYTDMDNDEDEDKDRTIWIVRRSPW
jgi:hypothetical protein